MSFFNRAVDSTSSFFKKNKNMLLLAGGMLIGGLSQAQTVTPDISNKIPKTDTSVTVKPYKEPKKRWNNSFYTFSVGATYTPQFAQSLWNAGARFHWEGNVGLLEKSKVFGNMLQMRGSYTLRNQSMTSNYQFSTPNSSGAGAYVFIPAEGRIDVLAGPKFGVASKKDKDYNKLVVMPYGGFGFSGGFGSGVEELTYMSPEAVAGLEVHFGKFGRFEMGKHNPNFERGVQFGLTARVEARQQFINNWSIGGQAVQAFYPPNNVGPNPRSLNASLMLTASF